MKPKNAILALIFIFLVGAIFTTYIYYTHQFVLKTADSLKGMGQKEESEEKSKEEIIRERKQVMDKIDALEGTSTPMTPEEKQEEIKRNKDIIKAKLNK